MTPVEVLGELVERLGELSGAQLAAATAHLAIVAIVVADLTVGHRRGATRSDIRQVCTAMVLATGSMILGVGYFMGFASAYSVIGGLVPWAGWAGGGPLLGGAVALVAVDVATWVHHWLSHHTRLGWACHRPHHTGDVFDASLALRQSWSPLPSLAVMPMVAFTGLPITATLVATAIHSAYSAATHIAAPIRLPRWWSVVFVTPGMHRVHHDTAGTHANFGGVLTVWDRLAGTFCGAAESADADACDSDGSEAVMACGVSDGRSVTEAVFGARYQRPRNRRHQNVVGVSSSA